MTTVSNKLTAGLDKVRDSKPTVATAVAPAPAAEKSTPAKPPAARKPVPPKPSAPHTPDAVKNPIKPVTRVWPD